MPNLTATLLTNRLFFPRWYIQPEPCVITKDSMMSWSSSGTLSSGTATVTGRSDGLSIHRRVATTPEKPTSVALLPFVNTTFNRISRMLSRHIKSVGLSPRKVVSFLRPVKDDLGLKTPGVYSIPCKCGQVYIE
jgi:hypothetical protein